MALIDGAMSPRSACSTPVRGDTNISFSMCSGTLGGAGKIKDPSRGRGKIRREYLKGYQNIHLFILVNFNMYVCNEYLI